MSVACLSVCHMYMNITTLEDRRFCIRLSMRGFDVCLSHVCLSVCHMSVCMALKLCVFKRVTTPQVQSQFCTSESHYHLVKTFQSFSRRFLGTSCTMALREVQLTGMAPEVRNQNTVQVQLRVSPGRLYNLSER